jgi:peptidoglycan hydrolase CwlO-like protein
MSRPATCQPAADDRWFTLMHQPRGSYAALRVFLQSVNKSKLEAVCRQLKENIPQAFVDSNKEAAERCIENTALLHVLSRHFHDWRGTLEALQTGEKKRVQELAEMKDQLRTRLIAISNAQEKASTTKVAAKKDTDQRADRHNVSVRDSDPGTQRQVAQTNRHEQVPDGQVASSPPARANQSITIHPRPSQDRHTFIDLSTREAVWLDLATGPKVVDADNTQLTLTGKSGAVAETIRGLGGAGEIGRLQSHVKRLEDQIRKLEAESKLLRDELAKERAKCVSLARKFDDEHHRYRKLRDRYDETADERDRQRRYRKNVERELDGEREYAEDLADENDHLHWKEERRRRGRPVRETVFYVLEDSSDSG